MIFQAPDFAGFWVLLDLAHPDEFEEPAQMPRLRRLEWDLAPDHPAVDEFRRDELSRAGVLPPIRDGHRTLREFLAAQGARILNLPCTTR